MEQIIIITHEQLATVIEIAVRKVIDEQNAVPVITPDPIAYLSLIDAAKFIGVQKQTMYGYTSRGKIPYTKCGGKLIRFLKSDLIAWVERNEMVRA